MDPHAAPRVFLDPASTDGAPRLAPGEAEHLLRVLRVREGERLLGLDGRGGAWPLAIRRIERGAAELEPAGAVLREPAPGEPGAPLPWIEVAVAWPRGPRAEEMLDRLVQLGAAAVQPLACRRTGPQAAGSLRRERLERIAREAVKQSRRSWTPEIGAPLDPAAFARARRGSAMALLDPAARTSLATWCAAPGRGGTRARPLVLAIGPEGGFDEEEAAALLGAGAEALRLAPHVLRIETAAEAALAVAVAQLLAGDR